MTFNNFEELVYTIENDLGEEFKNDFRQSRKSLAGLTNLPNNVLFSEFDHQKSEWVFNRGGKKEIQYHIFLRDGKLGYGLAINSQRGSFNNDDPAEIANDFGNAFKNLLDKIYQILPSYSFIIGSESDLGFMEEGEFILFGNSIPVSNNSIQNFDYQQLLADLNKQIEVYKLVYNKKNLITRNRKQISTQMESVQKQIKLLNYKKQIILQGPPGTGKTRKAKEICHKMISISEEFITKQIKVGMQINTTKGQVSYKILSANETGFTLEREKGTTNTVTFANIISAYDVEKWKNEISNNDDRMAVTIAKYLYDNFFKDNEQVKIIQFHPSYTYEDFVRGIVAESKGEKIEYRNVNKALGLFAEEALKNYQKSTKSDSILSKNEWINEQFENFVETVQSKIDDTGEYRLTDKVKLFDIDESAFYYTGDSWFDSAKHRMKFSDIKEALLSDPIDKKEFKALPNISGSAKQHYGYYYKVFSDFKNSITTKFGEATASIIEPKNYVLIIDEINRANLSSVLGELIYALEYRGEEVESMYSVDDSLTKSKLILPPNLYIIGTMNTADRSVGHIDYAIRRRFAFVDVMPKDLTSEMKDGEFYTDLFSAVKALFTENEYETKSDFISQEFEPKDVTLGHSYFIDKSEEGGDMKVRWNYEIKPILLEYVRDGVLKTDALGQINEIENQFTLKIE